MVPDSLNFSDICKLHIEIGFFKTCHLSGWNNSSKYSVKDKKEIIDLSR
jgi:hypothetical protein